MALDVPKEDEEEDSEIDSPKKRPLMKRVTASDIVLRELNRKRVF